jgi:uncharacterized protein YbaP (TraB family)
MGTMHVRDRRAFNRWQQVIQKVETCEVFAAEIQIEQLKSLPRALPAVEPLHRLLPVRKFQKLRRQLRKGAGIDIESCDYLPPVLILQLIDEALLARDYPTSLDESLWDYAKMQGKELLGLETVDAQFDFLRQLNSTFQVGQLLEVGSRWPRHRRQAMRMAALYEAEEIDRLYQSARQGAGKIRKTLLLQRNEHMTRSLSGLLRSQTVFCAVGAAHLGGGKGLLRLLKKDGFKVKPVPPT